MQGAGCIPVARRMVEDSVDPVWAHLRVRVQGLEFFFFSRMLVQLVIYDSGKVSPSFCSCGTPPNPESIIGGKDGFKGSRQIKLIQSVPTCGLGFKVWGLRVGVEGRSWGLRFVI